MTNLFHKVGAGIFSLGLAVSSLFGYHQTQSQSLGATAPQFTAAKPTTLYGGGISSSDTSIKVTALVTPAGTAITSAQLVGGVGSVYYVTIEPATSKKESVSCTGVTQNSDGTALLTGCTRGLQFTFPYTALASLQVSHSGGSPVVLSNSPQLYQDIINYVNNSLAAGVNDASLIAKGIVQVATGLQAASTTPIGGGSTSAPLALTTTISTSTANVLPLSALVIPVTDNKGKLDNNFIATSTLFKNSNLTGTTTMATTTINGIYPFGMPVLTTYVTNTNSATTSTFLGNDYLRITVFGSTTNSTDAYCMIFNGDYGPASTGHVYTFASQGMGGADCTGNSQQGIRLNRGNTGEQFFWTFDIMNATGSPKMVLGNGFIYQEGAPASSMFTATSTTIYSNPGNNPITSATFFDSSSPGNKLNAASYIRVYSDVKP